jgi:hypothetical protein
MEIPQGLKSREPGTSKGQQEQVTRIGFIDAGHREREQEKETGTGNRPSNKNITNIRAHLRQAY